MAEAGSPRPPAQNLPLILALSCALLALATLFVIVLRGGIAPSAPVAASSAAPSSTAAVARHSPVHRGDRGHAPAADADAGTGSGAAARSGVDGAEALANDEGSGGAAAAIDDPAAPVRPVPGDASAPPSVVAGAGLATEVPVGLGNSGIRGVVRFTGSAPEMKVPSKRKDAEFCKREDVPANAVIVKNGKLADVLVRLAPGSFRGPFPAPRQHALIEQRGCMFVPRIQGVVAGQEIDIANQDGTLHNVHTFKGTETWFNQAQPKGSPEIMKELEQAGIVKLTCDVHPWMRGFVVVSDHPFFAVSGEDGRFAIDHLPAGRYALEAWHSRYGWKKTTVSVAADTAVVVSFSYDGTEAEPPENRDELKGLF